MVEGLGFRVLGFRAVNDPVFVGSGLLRASKAIQPQSEILLMDKNSA